MDWTREQQRIIDLKGSNILVSAAAGSGKTAVMVERIIQLVKSGEDIDKFLVVTFTNSAAGGMKQKIQKSLLKAVKSCDGDIKHLRKQLSLLNKAMICTIDSFCMDAVKKNFHLAEIDPGFRVGDSSELSILLQESVDEALEEAYGRISDDSGFKELVEGFTGNRGDEELCELIKKTYQFIMSFPDPFQWLDDNLNKLNITGGALKNSKWFEEIKNHIKLLLDGAKGFINTALEICSEPDGPDLYIDLLAEDLNIVNNLCDLLDSDFTEFVRALIKFKAPRAKTFKPEDYPHVNTDKQEEVSGKKKKGENKKGLRDGYKDIITAVKNLLPYDGDFDKYADDINKMHGAMASLRDLIVETDKRYKNKKLEKSIADFNDLEHFALKILRAKNQDSNGFNPSDAAKAYQKKFNYIFIDEYQDSNSLQEAITEQIKRENNLFMVGDVKQSIYKFRLADPSIFNEKYNSYEHDRDDLSVDIINRTIDLNKNFRSRDEILKAVNFVFKNIMTKEIGEIKYDEKVFLNTGNTFETDNPVELNIIDKNSETIGSSDDDEDIDETYKKSKIDEEIESMETAELEAVFAVQKIKELMGREICEAGKPENGESKTRKTEYKDIVILLRSVSNWAGIFEERFNKEDIPFYYDGGKGYFETVEIQVLVNLLNIIDNIRQDIPLLSVMRSPIGNFTTEELLEIRLKYPREKHFINALDKYIKKINSSSSSNGDEPDETAGSGFSQDLIEKLTSFKEKIFNWSFRSRYSHLNDLIWDILMETNYYSFAGALPNGKMRQANLRLLADKAHDYEKTSMRGLFRFLRYIEKISKGANDTGTAKTLGENDNVVRLMSIHKSKGLEFPVVILCGLNKQFNEQDTRPKVLMHKEYGIGPKFIDIYSRTEKDTLARIAIKNKIKKENLSEEMRVLYVAMTRAVDKLIMVGTVNKLEEKSRKWRKGQSIYFVYKGLSYMDWVCGCLFKGIDFGSLQEIFNKGCCKKWRINKITRSSLSSKAREETYSRAERIRKMQKFMTGENSRYFEEIGRRLSFIYPYESSVSVPTKLSVTELKNLKKEEFAKLRYKIPPLTDIIEFNEESKKFILDKNISGSEIGTLLHFVMERVNIDGDLTSMGIKEQIRAMENKKLLTETEAKILSHTYADKIENFFNSDLGRRMKEASSINREVPFIIRKSADKVLDNLNKSDFILIQGIVDCYFIEGVEAVIIDYKTDTVNSNIEIDQEIRRIKNEYKGQVLLYKEAVETITGKKVKECYLYLLSINKEVLMD